MQKMEGNAFRRIRMVDMMVVGGGRRGRVQCRMMVT